MTTTPTPARTTSELKAVRTHTDILFSHDEEGNLLVPMPPLTTTHPGGYIEEPLEFLDGHL